MHEAISSYGQHLTEAGVDYAPSDPLPFEGLCVGRACESGGTAEVRTIGGLELIEKRDMAAGIYSDHATFSVGARLGEVLARRGTGARVLELGCGTGLLAILAVRLGCEVTATDVDVDALELAGRNAAANGVSLDLREGSLLEPVRDGEVFDLVIANLPHKPSAIGRGIWEVGGEEGDSLFSQVTGRLDRVVTPGGALLFFQHSLPHPRMLASLSRETELRLLAWKIRLFEEGEYGDVRDLLRVRHREGRSFVLDHDDAMGMVACVWHATVKEGS